MECKKCQKEGRPSDFPKVGENYPSKICRVCISTRKKKWKEKNKEKVAIANKKWREDNKEHVKTTLAKWYTSKKEDNDYITNKKAYSASWYLKNKDKIKSYRPINKDKLRKYRREYDKERKQIDIGFRISKNIRSRLSHAIREHTKSGSAITHLGCSIEDFRNYLETKFQSGMTWDNYGEWHIDHIVPLSKVDLTDPTILSRVCHYTNLQPLWKIENIKKSNKLLTPS